MEIQFDNHHLVATGNSSHLSPYSYAHDRNMKLSQLAVCVTGTPEYILDKLKKMVSELEELGKPLQGQIVTREGFFSEVITPAWHITPEKTDEIIAKKTNRSRREQGDVLDASLPSVDEPMSTTRLIVPAITDVVLDIEVDMPMSLEVLETVLTVDETTEVPESMESL